MHDGGIIDLVSSSGVADWVRLAITLGALGYLSTATFQNGLRIGWPLKTGLVLLLMRAVLDITDNYPALAQTPLLGAGDPTHEFYKTVFTGILGMGLVCVGACWDSVRNWRTVKALHREAQFHSSVLASLETGVLVLDRDKNVLFVNPKAVNALENHYNIETPASRAVQIDGGPAGVHVATETVEEKTYWVLEKVIDPVEDGGPLLLRTWWDVTRWESDQRLSQEFVYAVSHEFRTPLTSINGYLELALEDPNLDEETRQQLTIARFNADRLRAVVEDLLYLSQIEGGAVRYDVRPQDLPGLLNEAVQALGAEFASKRLRLRQQLPASPVWAAVDRERLLQVLANLLSNACKYTPSGGDVTLRIVPSENEVRLDVEDSGIGIPLEDQPRVFTRFFRSFAAKNLGVSGTGLGLAITKSLVEGMGGTIWFASEPAKGSTFSVSLPKATAPADVAEEWAGHQVVVQPQPLTASAS